MHTYRIVTITTGRLVGTVQAKTARGAILKAHKAFGYNTWNRAYLSE